jgi:hypothetical protein
VLLMGGRKKGRRWRRRSQGTFLWQSRKWFAWNVTQYVEEDLSISSVWSRSKKELW